ncbi:hypothetical protein AK812_SmicGene13773 [Symbiodinium microadriaticum]|uniref:Uncharacterized protein n=1 Tax=Symbiodinium microadriaticum TaxID=2951 RepID=A0A1Q9E787_SYMMI|nr:hypothetical protein AK812_SmicGene13773 [Symbiodinium microadriaticum]
MHILSRFAASTPPGTSPHSTGDHRTIIARMPERRRGSYSTDAAQRKCQKVKDRTDPAGQLEAIDRSNIIKLDRALGVRHCPSTALRLGSAEQSDGNALAVGVNHPIQREGVARPRQRIEQLAMRVSRIGVVDGLNARRDASIFTMDWPGRARRIDFYNGLAWSSD